MTESRSLRLVAIGFVVGSVLALLLLVSGVVAQERPPGGGAGTGRDADPDGTVVPPQEEGVTQAASEADEERAAPKLPAVLVTGQRVEGGVPVVPIDAVGSRDVFGPERVRETGARDVNDLVHHLPAIATRPYNGGEASAPSFSTRGLPDDGLTEYVHVLVDGVPASPLPYGWTAFSFFPVTPDRIHALDWIRGAHSVRYSPDTVGGVLNFVTQPIPDDATAGARSTFGTHDYSSNMVWGGLTHDGNGVLVSFVDRRGDGYRKDGGFDQQDLNVKLRRDLGGGDFVATSFTYMENEHQAPGGLTQAEFARDPFGNARPENRFEGYRGVADAVVHHEVGEETWVEGFTYFSATYRHLRAQRPHFPMPGDMLTISDWHDTSYVSGTGVRAEHRFELLGMEHALYGGARYQAEWIPGWTIHSEPYPGGPRTPEQDSEYALHALSLHLDDTVEPIERLKVTFGARVEWIPDASGDNDTGTATFDFDESFFTVLPGVGASYGITEDWTVFANYFQGFRAPQVWGFGEVPNPSSADLEFETSDSFEVGTRVRAPLGLTGSTTFWYNRYDDLAVYFSGFYESLGEIHAHGVDVEATWEAGAVTETLDGLALLGSITVQESELKSGPDAGNEVPYAWDTKAAWRARYEFCRGWVASLGGTFVGESFSDDANTRTENANGNLGINPDRTLWDAQLAKLIPVGEHGRLRLAVGATNLFDRDWYVHSRGGFFGGGKVAGPPLEAYASVDLTVAL